MRTLGGGADARRQDAGNDDLRRMALQSGANERAARLGGAKGKRNMELQNLELITTSEAARRLGISPVTARLLARTGKLPSVPIHGGAQGAIHAIPAAAVETERRRRLAKLDERRTKLGG